jgi:hypothetical protein
MNIDNGKGISRNKNAMEIKKGLFRWKRSGKGISVFD